MLYTYLFACLVVLFLLTSCPDIGETTIHYPFDFSVFSIHEDNFGIIWLGTREAGVHRFFNNEFHPFDPYVQYDYFELQKF
ncbi:MAG: hypothetical protein H6600_03330 [Flavobacteriales bacterium]|nr:hypothetical protein [Flavobacteriales bacterium]MCB9197464.1 hypothetical protein [Flavobacteriales bacterium]